jgi:hypothetical protein
VRRRRLTQSGAEIHVRGVVLPPDLDRLGDHLAAAARRKTIRRERRRRLAVAGIVGALAFGALNPAALDPSQRDVFVLRASAEQFVQPGDGAMVLHRPYAVQ